MTSTHPDECVIIYSLLDQSGFPLVNGENEAEVKHLSDRFQYATNKTYQFTFLLQGSLQGTNQ